jgi:DNA-binding phage protein
MLDDNDFIRLLRSEIERAGGQSALARREHIDRTLLNRVLWRGVLYSINKIAAV